MKWKTRTGYGIGTPMRVVKFTLQLPKWTRGGDYAKNAHKKFAVGRSMARLAARLAAGEFDTSTFKFCAELQGYKFQRQTLTPLMEGR